MTSGKSPAPKPDPSSPSSTQGAPAKQRSTAPKSAESPAKKTIPRARRTATQKPSADGVTGLTAQERHALVAQAAYFRAEARGFAAGRELEDWVAAEAEIGAQLANV
jgi:hypothetical protein